MLRRLLGGAAVIALSAPSTASADGVTRVDLTAGVGIDTDVAAIEQKWQTILGAHVMHLRAEGRVLIAAKYERWFDDRDDTTPQHLTVRLGQHTVAVEEYGGFDLGEGSIVPGYIRFSSSIGYYLAGRYFTDAVGDSDLDDAEAPLRSGYGFGGGVFYYKQTDTGWLPLSWGMTLDGFIAPVSGVRFDTEVGMSFLRFAFGLRADGAMGAGADVGVRGILGF